MVLPGGSAISGKVVVKKCPFAAESLFLLENNDYF